MNSKAPKSSIQVAQNNIGEIWEGSTNNKALFSPNPITLTRKLAKEQSSHFEFTPFQHGKRQITFDVSALRGHAEKVASNCGWKLTQYP